MNLDDNLQPAHQWIDTTRTNSWECVRCGAVRLQDPRSGELRYMTRDSKQAHPERCNTLDDTPDLTFEELVQWEATAIDAARRASFAAMLEVSSENMPLFLLIDHRVEGLLVPQHWITNELAPLPLKCWTGRNTYTATAAALNLTLYHEGRRVVCSIPWRSIMGLVLGAGGPGGTVQFASPAEPIRAVNPDPPPKSNVTPIRRPQ